MIQIEIISTIWYVLSPWIFFNWKSIVTWRHRHAHTTLRAFTARAHFATWIDRYRSRSITLLLNANVTNFWSYEISQNKFLLIFNFLIFLLFLWIKIVLIIYNIDWSHNEIRLYIFEILYLVIFQLIIEIYKYISIYCNIHNINIMFINLLIY